MLAAFSVVTSELAMLRAVSLGSLALWAWSSSLSFLPVLGKGCWEVCKELRGELSVAGESEQMGLNGGLQVGAAALGPAILCKVICGN